MVEIGKTTMRNSLMTVQAVIIFITVRKGGGTQKIRTSCAKFYYFLSAFI